MVSVAVIGAGVVGLATAVNIQEKVSGSRVTIIADKFEKDTTSIGAGGIFRPTFKRIKGSKSDIRRWIQTSWDYFEDMNSSGKGGEVGSFYADGYSFSYNDEIDPLMQELVFSCRLLSDEEKRKKGFKMPYAFAISTICVSPSKYLPYLMQKFRQNGGAVYFKTVSSLKEFAGKFDVVVNCCGIRAQQLVNDDKIFPVRGQLRRVRAPWVKLWYMNTDDDIVVLPQHNGDVILGGCRQKGNYSLDLDRALQEDIVKRCEDLVPAIKGAETVHDWVGLRPTREPIRLEKELMDFDGKTLKVVHNYGHGANGIALSWGTAVDAAALVQDWVHQLPHKSKL